MKYEENTDIQIIPVTSSSTGSSTTQPSARTYPKMSTLPFLCFQDSRSEGTVGCPGPYS